MHDHCQDIVVPGDIVTKHIEKLSTKNDKVKLGPGLRQDNDEVVVCKSGILQYKTPNIFWVDSHQKRYIPIKGENVLGVVVGKVGDAYKVDIGSADQVLLNSLSFEGATKRNRPNLINGDIVFGKLVVANKDMEPELSCMDQNSGKANGMGQITADGFLFTVSLDLVRKILLTECILLSELGRLFKFEIIIGLNGKIHLSSSSTSHVIAIMKMIIAAEYMTNEQIRQSLSETESNFQ